MKFKQLCVMGIVIGCAATLMMVVQTTVGAETQTLKYPATKRTDQTDTYHGVKVADPYRWLEDDVRQSKEVAGWVEAENKVTFKFLEEVPQRDAIRKLITRLYNFPRLSTPWKVANRYFFSKNNGLQNQSVFYTMTSLDQKPEVLLDPNSWSKNGTVALSEVSVSNDAKRLAYQVNEAGSDWAVWRFIDIETKKKLDDELKHIKFGGASWAKDGKSFYYSRLPEPKKGEKFQALNLNQAVYLHRIGTPQSEDKLVYHLPEHPDWSYAPKVTEDGRYLVITVHVGTDSRYRITVLDLTKPDAKPIELIDNFKNEYTFVGNANTLFYFQTDLDAPRKRLVAIDLADPKRTLHEIIPQKEETLEEVHFICYCFIASYLQDVKSLVKIYWPNGQLARTLDTPGIGSVSGFGGTQKETETFYTFNSFATPPTTYRYDVISGRSEIYHRAEVKFDPAKYTVKQIFYKSKDGTRVPMFVVHRKDIKLDGSNPTVLYGYGGFSISLTPRFSLRIASWLELGGVFVVANLRGGGEYGEAWHKAGTKLKKQNVFDDFIAAAETLIEKGYTRTDKLAIMGGSNGGLLVGAVMTQRPDLFGACLPAVGVMDMLRFHQFTAGRFWTDDYGSADNPDEFKTLRAYSPYHNLKPGTCYPATLITTADTDDRVVPGHSFKFAAALQKAQSCNNPVLIRIETEAGHGMGKPTTKQIDEMTDMWAFLVRVLKMQVAL